MAGSSRDVHEILPEICQRAARLCGADRGTLFLWDENPQEVFLASSELESGEDEDETRCLLRQFDRRPLDELPLISHLATSREPIHIDDARRSPLVHQDSVELFALRTLFGVPLIAEARVIGALVFHRREVGPFKEHQRELGIAAADLVALVLQKALMLERLVQSEKLRAQVEMAGGVAHDFNNLLTSILGRSQYLLSEIENGRLPERKAQDSLSVIEQAARTGAETVRRLLEYTHSQPRGNRIEAVDVDLALRQMKSEIDALGTEVEVEIVRGDAPRAASNRSELREVLRHLTSNAIDAMPDGGKLILESGADQGRVYIKITDTGPGMAPEVQERIFDPFFTTKGPRSSGLGLSVSYGILRRHGGEIEVVSPPGQGTTVALRLPFHEPEANRHPKAVTCSEERPLRVLVVDDEPSVRELLGEILTNLGGHRVFKAESGNDGLKLLEDQAVDLVLTDLGMPGMTGWEVARQVKVRWPAVKIGIISGWSSQVVPEDLEENGVDFLCSKPFEVADLLSRLSTL